MSTCRALRGQSGTWALRGHFGTRRTLEHLGTRRALEEHLGTWTLGYSRYLDTQGTLFSGFFSNHCFDVIEFEQVKAISKACNLCSSSLAILTNGSFYKVVVFTMGSVLKKLFSENNQNHLEVDRRLSNFL